MRTLKRNILILLFSFYALTVLVMTAEDPATFEHNLVFYGGLFFIPFGLVQILGRKEYEAAIKKYQRNARVALGIIFLALGGAIFMSFQLGEIMALLMILGVALIVLAIVAVKRDGNQLTKDQPKKWLKTDGLHNYAIKSRGLISW